MDNRIFVLSVMLLGVAYGTLISGKPDKLDSGGIHDLKMIGAVDGVTYFYENVTRTWVEAGDFCETAGMHLALINTVNQHDLLKWVDFEATLYWTAGIASQELKHFAWNSTNGAVPEFIKEDYHPRGIRTCMFASKAANNFTLYYDYCENRHSTLCARY